MKYALLLALQCICMPALATLSFTFSNSELRIVSDADDTIVVTGENDVVLVNGQPIPNETVLVANVHFIGITGGPGNNLIDTTAVTKANGFTWTHLNLNINGRDGDDTIISGATRSSLIGGLGVDSLTGGAALTTFSWGVGQGGADTIDGSLCTNATLITSLATGADLDINAQIGTAHITSDSETFTAIGMDRFIIHGSDGDNTILMNDLSSLMLDEIHIYSNEGTDIVDASKSNTPIIFELQRSSFDSTFIGSSTEFDQFILQLNILGGSSINFSNLNDKLIFERTEGLEMGTATISDVEKFAINTGRGADIINIEDISNTGLEYMFIQTYEESDTFTMVGSAGVEFELNADAFQHEAGIIDQLTIDAELNTVTEAPGQVQIGGKGLITYEGFETFLINNQGADLTDIWVAK